MGHQNQKNKQSVILRASSKNPNLEAALKEIAKQNQCSENGYTIFFYSSHYKAEDLEVLAPKLLGKNCAGCSTAGEIGPDGYLDNGISAITFKSPDFICHELLLEEIANKGLDYQNQMLAFKKNLAKNCEKLGNQAKSFVLSLFDGLSVQEEQIMGFVGNFLTGIPIVGGSAGDALNFKITTIYTQGKVYSNCALFIGVSTARPFRVFKTQHFEESESKVVITKSEPEQRVVHEIDGMPAAESYAQTLKIAVEQFSPKVFSKNPIMLKIGDNFYVRSIQKANPDGSLKFYCAIDDGLVLTLAKRGNFKEITETALKKIEEELGGEIDAILGFECILRKLEVDDMKNPDREQVQSLYRKYHILGFHTYGEQFGAIHVNQTFAGVAFG